MFIAALFIIVKKLQTAHISIKRGMEELWYSHSGIQLSKKKKLLIHTKTWMTL